MTATVSCASEPDTIDHPALVGRFAPDPSVEPLIAEQAYISESSFFVRFRQGEQEYYGPWRWRQAYQNAASYVAAKFGLRGFVYGLREDLLGRPIRITTVCPTVGRPLAD